MDDPNTNDRVCKTVIAIIADVLAISANKIPEDANLMLDLGADSLELTEIVMRIEETFNIDLSDIDQQMTRRVSDFTEEVRKRIRALKRE